MNWARTKLRLWLGADVRSLALFRVALAVTILFDLWHRSLDLRAHYTDEGVFPRAVALTSFSSPYWFSFHMIHGSVAFTAGVFVVHALVALSLMVGYRTQVSCALAWVMCISLQVRNEIVLHSGDVYMRVVIFWAFFMPLGKVFSVDAALNYASNGTPKPMALRTIVQAPASGDNNGMSFDVGGRTRVLPLPAHISGPAPRVLDEEAGVVGASGVLHRTSGAGVGRDANAANADNAGHDDKTGAGKGRAGARGSAKRILAGDDYVVCDFTTLAIPAQVAILYVFSVFHKSGPEWTVYYSATFYALQLDFFRTRIGDFFLAMPKWTLEYLTFAVWEYEKWGSAFLFAPFFTPQFRWLACLGYFALHLGLGSCLRLAMFTFITCAATLAMWPSWVWDSLVFPCFRVPWRTALRVRYDLHDPFFTLVARLAHTFLLLPETDVAPMAGLPRRHRRGRGRRASGNSSSSRSGDGGGGKGVPGGMDRPDAASGDDNRDAIESRRDLGSRQPLVVVDDYGVQHTGVGAIETLLLFSPWAWPFAYLFRLGFVRVAVAWSITLGIRLTYAFHPGRPLRRPKAYRPLGELLFGEDFKFSPVQSFGDYWYYAKNILVAFLVCYVFFWNMGNIGSEYYPPESWRWIAESTQLNQAWMMFSPNPPKVSFYYIIRGTLADDSEVELFRNEGFFNWEGTEFNWDPPVPFHASFKNHRWFKFYEAYNWGQGYSDIDAIRLNMGRYICREWNARHEDPKKLWTFAWYMVNLIVDENGDKRTLERVPMWEHICFGEKPQWNENEQVWIFRD